MGDDGRRRRSRLGSLGGRRARGRDPARRGGGVQGSEIDGMLKPRWCPKVSSRAHRRVFCRAGHGFRTASENGPPSKTTCPPSRRGIFFADGDWSIPRSSSPTAPKKRSKRTYRDEGSDGRLVLPGAPLDRTEDTRSSLLLRGRVCGDPPDLCETDRAGLTGASRSSRCWRASKRTCFLPRRAGTLPGIADAHRDRPHRPTLTALVGLDAYDPKR
jgi:hypothetical protein